jgi:hypothetical protein
VTRPFREAFDIAARLSSGFRALKVAPWPLLLGALLMQCTEGGSGSGGNYSGSGGSGDDGSWDSYDWENLGASIGDLATPDPAGAIANVGGAELAIIAVVLVLALGVGLLCGGAMLAFRSWVHGGYVRLHRQVLRTGAGGFDTLFGASDVFVSMIGFKLLWGLIYTGTLMLALLPGGVLVGAGAIAEVTPLIWVGVALMVLVAIPVALYVTLGLVFGELAVALDGAKAMQAVERSWELARGNRLWLLLYLFVTGMFTLVGICLCCFGVVFTRAIADTGLTEAYLLATRPAAELEGWWSLER